MFKSLPQYLRDHELQGGVGVILLIKKSMERGLINTLGDLYITLKSIVSSDKKDFGPFTVAFYHYFLDIEIKKGESLLAAIRRSDTFKNWLKNHGLEDIPTDEVNRQVEIFIDEVHLTSFDIKKILSGEDILKNDDPDRKDTLGPDDDPVTNVDKAADYSNVSIDELMERMRRVMEQQRRRHSGGDHWVGTGGVSPFGSGGAAQGGIRAGGGGGGKMARKVIGDRNFYPVDTKEILSDNNVDIALAYLKGIEDQSVEQLLDIPTTIKEGVKEGGLFLPYEKEKIEQKVQVILMIDNGGWSMSPYVKSVTRLFSKMKRRFAHDLKTYYFHNTIYGGAFKDVKRNYSSFEKIEKLCALDKNYALFIIGDADMAPYELGEDSIKDWQSLEERYPRAVWLNPMEERFWTDSYTVNVLKKIFRMFPLSPYGIEKAVEYMNQKRKFG